MSELTQARDESFGCIPLRTRAGQWEVLLVEHRYGGNIKPPKGHAEPGETPEQAARRELYEETGIDECRLETEPQFHESYRFARSGQIVEKRVTYFLSFLEGGDHAAPREDDVIGCKWLPLTDAIDAVTYLETKKVLQDVKAHLGHLEDH